MEMNKMDMLSDNELTRVSGGTGEPAAKFSVGQRVTIGASGPALDFGTVADRRYANGTWQYILTTDSGATTDWLDESTLRTESERKPGKVVMK